MRTREQFLPYMEQIKALGYRVFVNKDELKQTYCFIADEQGRIGYCQLGDFGYGCRFSTKHKGTKDFGGGFSIHDWDEPVYEIKRHHIEEALQLAPNWAIQRYGMAKLQKVIKKWTLEEYLSSYWGQGYIEYNG